MATVKFTNGKKKSLGAQIKYITDPKKTNENLISGVNCSPETAKEEMQTTKKLWDKTGGRQYKHLVQSWHKDENITPEAAHKLGCELIERSPIFEGFEVIVSTHIDKDHIHNHFLINSVNFLDGHKFQQSNGDLEALRNLNDTICRENRLTVCEKGKTFEGLTRTAPEAWNKKTYEVLKKAELKKGDSYVRDIMQAVLDAQNKAQSKEEFVELMDKQGIDVLWADNRKYITFTDRARQSAGEKKCKVRNNRLEQYYNVPLTKEALLESFEVNKDKPVLPENRTKEQWLEALDHLGALREQGQAGQEHVMVRFGNGSGTVVPFFDADEAKAFAKWINEKPEELNEIFGLGGRNGAAGAEHLPPITPKYIAEVAYMHVNPWLEIYCGPKSEAVKALTAGDGRAWEKAARDIRLIKSNGHGYYTNQQQMMATRIIDAIPELANKDLMRRGDPR